MLSDQHRSPVVSAWNQPAPLLPHKQQQLQQQLPLPWGQRLSWPGPRSAAGPCAGSWWNGNDPRPSHGPPATGRHFRKAYKLWLNKMKIVDTFANLVCDWFSSCVTSVPRPRAPCQVRDVTMSWCPGQWHPPAQPLPAPQHPPGPLLFVCSGNKWNVNGLSLPWRTSHTRWSSSTPPETLRTSSKIWLFLPSSGLQRNWAPITATV